MTDNSFKLWEEFVLTGEVNEKVKPYIAESWQRSKKYGVDYATGGYGLIIDQKEFDKILAKNKDLIEIAMPVMRYLYNTFIGTETIIMLSDSDDNVLEIIGDKRIIDFFAGHNLIKGAHWGEKIVGTNGMTLARLLDSPVQTLAQDHYCILHHNSTCSCAPIHNESGKVIGVLNIANLMELHSRHSLGMVAAGAKLIEEEIALFRTNKLIENTFNNTSEGILIIGSDLKIKIANKMALSILNLEISNILGRDIYSIIPDLDLSHFDHPIRYKSYSLYSNSMRIRCICNIQSLRFNEENVGITISFTEEKTNNKLANQIAGNKATYTFDDIITKNKMMKATMQYAKKMAKINCNLLITGESGVGKELFAQAIHNESNCANGPFVAVNCAAMPRDLVESELFGYEGGSFTGSRKEGFPGKFELANGGTLFLDEIGELPLSIQPKLLRVLDDHKVTRIGGTHPTNLDIRLIFATNRDLSYEVYNNNFRLDLFYRINVVSIEIPPLSKRPEDIECLAHYFLNRLNQKLGKNILSFSNDFFDKLRNYPFPGNVRQLENLVARAYYLCEESIITSDYLPIEMNKDNESSLNQPVKPIEEIEKDIIVKQIIESEGNITRVANELKMSKPTLYRKIKKYSIDIDSLRDQLV
ncbi:MAG: sigma-54-dependent Fis family transcriptional regulator [Anaerovoracaceae bacterium]|jgi:transcriptional regulator of acetoin/glycerol metabolism